MQTLRIHGYAFAVLCCFIILTEASQTDPSEGEFVKPYKTVKLSVSLFPFWLVILDSVLVNLD